MTIERITHRPLSVRYSRGRRCLSRTDGLHMTYQQKIASLAAAAVAAADRAIRASDDAEDIAKDAAYAARVASEAAEAAARAAIAVRDWLTVDEPTQTQE